MTYELIGHQVQAQPRSASHSLRFPWTLRHRGSAVVATDILRTNAVAVVTMEASRALDGLARVERQLCSSLPESAYRFQAITDTAAMSMAQIIAETGSRWRWT